MVLVTKHIPTVYIPGHKYIPEHVYIPERVLQGFRTIKSASVKNDPSTTQWTGITLGPQSITETFVII
jgi:hypothetical protein